MNDYEAPGGAEEPVPARDDGLQQERTRLAWRRTGLALAVAGLIGARVALRTSPVLTVGALLCLALALSSVLVTSRARWFSGRSDAETAFDDVLVDGRLPALVTAATALLAVVEIGYLVTRN